MADNTKAVFYSRNPENLNERTKLGVLRLKGDKVETEFFNDVFEREVRAGVYDALAMRLIGPDAGKRFFNLMVAQFGTGSFVDVDVS